MGEVEEEMKLDKEGKRKKLNELRSLKKDQEKILDQLSEALKNTYKELKNIGENGEKLPGKLPEEINEIVEATKYKGGMAERWRQIRELMNTRYHNSADVGVQKYRKLASDENLEKYYEAEDNLSSIREEMHRLK